jgi:hypothetical protein
MNSMQMSKIERVRQFLLFETTVAALSLPVKKDLCGNKHLASYCNRFLTEPHTVKCPLGMPPSILYRFFTATVSVFVGAK